MTITSLTSIDVDWIACSMANRKHRLLRILVLLVLAGLIGHFVVDISARESLTTFDLHDGFILPPLIVLSGALMLIITLLDDDPIRRRRFLHPQLHPPSLLH